MLSYNQIIKLNKEFADAHYVLQNFGNGERWQVVDHNQDATFKYPLMWMEDLVSPVQEKEFVYSFRIWFVTRVEAPSDRDGNPIYFEFAKAKSDMIQCAQDLIAYWIQDNNYPTMDIDRSVSIETFIENTDDKLAGCYADIRFRESFNYDSCIIPMGGVTPPVEETCDPVTVYINGVLFGTIASGGTTDIAVHDTAGNDVGTKSGSVQEIADVTQTLNGSSITNNKAETSKAITIRYADDSPVTVTTITDTEDTFIGEVPNTTTPIDTAALYLTGANVTVTAGDDGSQMRQRGTDFYNLAITNGFGNNMKRFTGTTGGYFDEVNNVYYDVDDNATTEAGAFPNGLIVNWAQWDQINNKVLCMDKNYLQTGQNRNMISGAPYTRGGFAGFYVANIKELHDYFLFGGLTFGWGSVNYMNWPPLSYTVGSPSTTFRVASSTYFGTSQTYCMAGTTNLAVSISHTSSYTTFLVNYLDTVTDLGL